MPEGEDSPVPGFINFVEVGVAFRLPADGSADDGDGDITDPTDKRRLETIHLLLAARYRACIRSRSCYCWLRATALAFAAAHVIAGCAQSRLQSQPLMLLLAARACIRGCSCHRNGTYTDFADLTCEIRDIRGSLFSRSAAISPLFFRWRTPQSSTIQKREAS